LHRDAIQREAPIEDPVEPAAVDDRPVRSGAQDHEVPGHVEIAGVPAVLPSSRDAEGVDARSQDDHARAPQVGLEHGLAQ
jgi:hypothetical protein